MYTPLGVFSRTTNHRSQYGCTVFTSHRSPFANAQGKPVAGLNHELRITNHESRTTNHDSRTRTPDLRFQGVTLRAGAPAPSKVVIPTGANGIPGAGLLRRLRGQLRNVAPFATLLLLVGFFWAASDSFE